MKDSEPEQEGSALADFLFVVIALVCFIIFGILVVAKVKGMW